jgi:uncharacterized membrane protein YecN with MAPEG domain
MDHPTLIVLVALLQYLFFTGQVGLARGKYKVNAPACEGDENFSRLFRVQQNTLEQLIIFIPASYAFAYYLSEIWVLVPGVVFILGRFLYSAEYLKDPKTRTPGMALTLLANVVLVLGALYGVLNVMFFR